MTGRKLSREEELFRQSLFTRWTAGFSPIEQRINIFYHIRDIPYAIVPAWREAEDIIRLMITENRGWCGPKHHLLMWMFEQLGIKVEPVFIPFRWQDQQVNYSNQLRNIIPSIPGTNHLCCKVYLNEMWQIIDATWDPLLKKAGFPVNDFWDGISGTIPAVTGICPEEKKQIILPSPTTWEQRTEFIIKLNNWMEEVRNQKT